MNYAVDNYMFKINNKKHQIYVLKHLVHWFYVSSIDF